MYTKIAIQSLNKQSNIFQMLNYPTILANPNLTGIWRMVVDLGYYQSIALEHLKGFLLDWGRQNKWAQKSKAMTQSTSALIQKKKCDAHFGQDISTR